MRVKSGAWCNIKGCLIACLLSGIQIMIAVYNWHHCSSGMEGFIHWDAEAIQFSKAPSVFCLYVPSLPCCRVWHFGPGLANCCPLGPHCLHLCIYGLRTRCWDSLANQVIKLLICDNAYWKPADTANLQAWSLTSLLWTDSLSSSTGLCSGSQTLL